MYRKSFWSDDDLSEEDTLPFHVTLHQTVSHCLMLHSLVTSSCRPFAWPQEQAGKEPSSPCPSLSQKPQASLKPNLCRPGAPSGAHSGSRPLLCRISSSSGVWGLCHVGCHHHCWAQKALLSRAPVPSFQCTLLCQLVPLWAVPCVWWRCSPVSPEQICTSCSWGQEANTLVMVHCRLHKDSSHGLGTGWGWWRRTSAIKGAKIDIKGLLG